MSAPAAGRDRRWDVGVLAFYVPVALLSVAFIGWRAGRSGLAERLVGDHPLLDLALGAVTGAVLAVASRALSRWPAPRKLEETLVRLLGPLPASTCVLLAVSSGLAEELAFRGALQPEIGLLPAALVFGLVHVPVERGLVAWPFLAAAVGVLFGGLFAVTGSVVAPAAAHGTVNLLNLRYLSRKASELASREAAAAASDTARPSGAGPEDREADVAARGSGARGPGATPGEGDVPR